MDFGLFFFFVVSSVAVAAAAPNTKICPFESLYQLGDSISDTGNLVRILPVGPSLPAARPPYGVTFPGSPTGRWSDGKLIIDFTALGLGVPSPRPYLDKNFTSGINFAVAGSTALDSSFFTVRGIIVPQTVASLNLQLTWFTTYLASICSTPPECAGKLRSALIFMGEIGGNDINYALTQGKSLEEIKTYVPSINQAIINATRETILAGALHIVVPGNFPIGCFPFGLSAFGTNDSTAYDQLGCIKSLNNLTAYQNNNLQIALHSLRREFPDALIIYADYYNAFLSILHHASILGFDRKTLLKPCCESKEFNPLSQQFCGSRGVAVCRKPNRYIHWDGLHLTQEAYRHISNIIVNTILLKIK